MPAAKKVLRKGIFVGFETFVKREKWCRRTDSNRGPEVYKTPALPTELRRLPVKTEREGVR